MRDLTLSRDVFTDLATAVTERGGDFRFVAQGHSMWPLIRHNEILHIAPPTDFRLGDVILAKLSSGAIVSHRVIRIEQRLHECLFLLKGDSCQRPDEYVRAPQILGKVISKGSIERSASLTTLKARTAGILAAYLTPRILLLYNRIRKEAQVLSTRASSGTVIRFRRHQRSSQSKRYRV